MSRVVEFTCVAFAGFLRSVALLTSTPSVALTSEAGRRQDLSARAVQYVNHAVGIRMDQHRAIAALPVQICCDQRTACAEPVKIVRIDRHEPACGAGGGVAREHTRGEIICPWPLLGIPGRRMAGGMDQQAQCRIVDRRTCKIAAALLPRIGRPTAHTQVTLMGKVGRSEVCSDAHLRVGSGVVALPQHLTRRSIQCRHPAAHPEIAAAVADEDAILRHQRRREQRLAALDLGHRHVPQHAAGRGIQRDCVTVERVQEQASR
jgi:hypothetical protein